jgi:hypothetical protein
MLHWPPGVMDVPLVHRAADEVDAGVDSVGIIDIPTGPVVGNTLIVGIVTAGLTPRLPISVEPNGIPVRATPPGVVGDVDVGVDEEAMLLEPEPHIPDSPDVCGAADVAEVPDIAIESDMAPVAGVVLPTVIPPPS